MRINTTIIIILIFISPEIIAAKDMQRSTDFSSSKFMLRLSEKGPEKYDINIVFRDSYDILQNSYDEFDSLSEDDEKLTHIINQFKRELALVPVKREINIAQSDDSITFSAFGFTTQLPWKEQDKTYRTDPVSCIVKYNQWLVAIEDPADSTGSLAYETWKYGYLDSIFYDGPPNSLYEFVKTIMRANPTDFKKAQNLLEIVREKRLLVGLLNVKCLYTHENNEQGIYVDSIFSFDLPNVKGFQIGRPGSSNQTVLLLFPNNDTEFTVRIFKGENGEVTQHHIDYIIRNFGPDIKN